MPLTATSDDLSTFLEGLPPDEALQARTLAHAWVGGGGRLHVGKVAVRLVAGDPTFTAGTIHGTEPRLELCRVLLERHGVDNDRWQYWSDEFADLAHLGFDPFAKYPTLPLGDGLSAAELTRLVMGLRDLAQMAG